MKYEKVAPRYSKALFELDGSKEQRLAILEKLLNYWNKDDHLKTILSSPTITKEEKMSLLKALGDQKDEKLSDFLNLLIQNNRTKALPIIIREYKNKVIKSQGILEVTVSTAVAIDPNDKEALKTKLEHQYHRKIELKEQVDPKMIGGVILKMGDKLLDYSINGRLENLRKQLCQ
jgi:F-type H+-transporting ATPase subunit delta